MHKLVGWLGLALAALILVPAALHAQAAPRPNILWITSEDNGPQLGAYGDGFATTPNLDALASRGMVFLHAWSNAPVCAPARTAIISGLYPTSAGGEHMRSMARLPASMRLFPAYLRELGYYTTNNVKEDYNLEKTADVWDESSPKAHWRGRKPGQPFFAVFNTTVTHESNVRRRPYTPTHDPARVPLPPYHPDHPEVRADWAQYYDRLTEMDRFAGERLAELAADGLAEDTIVFYFGDHGPGLPRAKRWPYNSGLHVPLIVYVPQKLRGVAPPWYAAGGRSRRLVSFVDLAPTLLSAAGRAPLPWMQGRAFLGPHATPDPEYIFGFRGRMDERYDMVRSVRDGRYVYVRNYHPHRPYGQYLSYMFQTPTTQVWKRLHDEGKLQPPQTFFWESKPAEELYDLETDPYEVRNLAAAPEHRATRDRLRAALAAHLRATGDLGFLPEHEMWRRAGAGTLFELARDRARYDVDRIAGAAEAATDAAVPVSTVVPGLQDADPAVRYWAAVGLIVRGDDAVRRNAAALETLLTDRQPGPRIAAAEALGRHGSPAQAQRARGVLLAAADVTTHGLYASLLALNALNHLGDAPADTKAAVAKLPTAHPSIHDRERDYLVRLVEAIGNDWR